jgi:hypothetical protein
VDSTFPLPDIVATQPENTGSSYLCLVIKMRKRVVRELGGETGSTSLPCLFRDDVPCPYRRDKKFGLMVRCFKCSHYERFMTEMQKEDERIMDEIDEIRRTGVWK